MDAVDPQTLGGSRTRLFLYLRLIAVALIRKEIKGPEAGLLLIVALTSDALSGERAVVDEPLLAAAGRMSSRSVWRHHSALTEAGWLVQTATPTRGSSGKPGRRARYALTWPKSTVDLAGIPWLDRIINDGGALDLRSAPNRLPEVSGTVSDESAEGIVCQIPTNRLPKTDESSASVTRDRGTVLPSVGIPSVGSALAAAADDLDSSPANGGQQVSTVQGLTDSQWLVSRLDVSEADADDCIAWANGQNITSVRGYLSGFTADDVATRAQQHRQRLADEQATARSAAARAARLCPEPGHRGAAGLDPDGDPLCGDCATSPRAGQPLTIVPPTRPPLPDRRQEAASR